MSEFHPDVEFGYGHSTNTRIRPITLLLSRRSCFQQELLGVVMHLHQMETSLKLRYTNTLTAIKIGFLADRFFFPNGIELIL